MARKPPVPALAIALAATAAVCAAPAAAAVVRPVAHVEPISLIRFFHVPSKQVYCAYQTRPYYLRCDTHFKTRFSHRHHRCAQGDYGNSFAMHRRGRARPICISDSVYDPDGRRLRYRHTYRYGPFRCRVTRRRGLHCINRARHGMALKRHRVRLR